MSRMPRQPALAGSATRVPHRHGAYLCSHRALTAMILAVLLQCFHVDALALSLAEAERLALQSDPLVESHAANARSYDAAAVSEGTLPDPKLLLGAVNVPVDSFDLAQEPMTQLKIGIRQDFPRGDSLDLMQQQSQWLSRAQRHLAENARRETLSSVRRTFFNLYYEVAALHIVSETRKLFTKLVGITESSYAAGRANQQDVILASLELSRLDDRAVRIKGQEESYRAELAQWIGEQAWREIDDAFPQLPDPGTSLDIDALIAEHPKILAHTASVNATKASIDMARQEYKPGWSASLDYGFRSGNNPDGSDRADLATALVSLDIPLFTSNRQDRKVAASREKATAAQLERDDSLRQLKRMYEKNLHQWQRLGERAERYRTGLLASAHDNTRASLNAYQSGVTEFNTLMRAQITELDVRLEDLRIRVDRAITQANLLYVTGDNPL